jgi:hypothetical protein
LQVKRAPSGTQIQIVAGSNSTADSDTYTQKAQGDMPEWQQKLRAFSETVEAKGDKAGIAAENELNTAWSKTGAEAHKPQTAGAADWENAKGLLREGIPRTGGQLGEESTPRQVSAQRWVDPEARPPLARRREMSRIG